MKKIIGYILLALFFVLLYVGERQYRYKKTGEVYNGQIYVNGECCTDGHGNEIILDYKENI